MVERERISDLNSKPVRPGKFVLYWMQASQRADCNHALEYAVGRANDLGVPTVACFGLTDEYPQANARHFEFMLEGLAETARRLAARGVQLVVHLGRPEEVAVELADQARLVVADMGYLRHQTRWRRRVAVKAPCRVLQVESDVVVPTRVASNKAEYAARTIRPKLACHWPKYLVRCRRVRAKRDSLDLRLGGIDLSDTSSVMAGLRTDRSVKPVGRYYSGGHSNARKLLKRFIRDKLSMYADRRGDPSLDIQSHMSPYLHFGQISPIEIALAITKASDKGQDSIDSYIEELLVRRELSMNFVRYTSDYDRYSCLPAWARASLDRHRRDKRPYIYTRRELEDSLTHDTYWNAAMREMRLTGKMHNYMRMYWAKKIIEWTASPATAFRRILAINNKYFLDGRDPVSCANVAWCFGKHDRPWKNRPVFGTIRYMNAAGLRRKFDMESYVRWTEGLGQE